MVSTWSAWDGDEWQVTPSSKDEKHPVLHRQTHVHRCDPGQRQSWWPTYHVFSLPTLSFPPSPNSPPNSYSRFWRGGNNICRVSHWPFGKLLYPPFLLLCATLCVFIPSPCSFGSTSSSHLLNNSVYLSLSYLVNITLSFCHLLNDSHNIHLPVPTHNHLVSISKPPPLLPTLLVCFLPNDFHYFSFCYLLFNNHVSRMCMYIHRQFSAVVMRKSITLVVFILQSADWKERGIVSSRLCLCAVCVCVFLSVFDHAVWPNL